MVLVMIDVSQLKKKVEGKKSRWVKAREKDRFIKTLLIVWCNLPT
jgi:hypothetical protein